MKTQEEIDREEYGCLQNANGIILEKGKPYYSKEWVDLSDYA